MSERGRNKPEKDPMQFFSGALDTVKNAMLDMEGSSNYLTSGGGIRRNWVHNMLGVGNDELRERAGRAIFNSDNASELRQRYGGSYRAFANDLGKQGTDAVTAGMKALVDPKGGVRQLRGIGQGEKADGVNLFNAAERDELQGTAIKAVKQDKESERLANDKAEALQAQQLLTTDPNFIRQGKQLELQNNIALAGLQDKREERKQDREMQALKIESDTAIANKRIDFQNAQANREFRYQQRRDAQARMDDLFKMIMAGTQAFI